MSKYQAYNSNQTGRDFICSDIHGHFSLLESYLSEVQFDKAKDRLFCLGDMIDRGDESPLVINYLNKPWFYSILGNHESMLIDAYENDNDQVKQQWYRWGGEWARDLDQESLSRFYEALVELPIAIELNLLSGAKVGLIHAELPLTCRWKDVVTAVSAKGKRDNSTSSKLIYGMLWGNGDIYNSEAQYGYIKPVEDIDHVFHGHTIISSITTCANRTFMDLGVYKTGSLGLLDPNQFLRNSGHLVGIGGGELAK